MCKNYYSGCGACALKIGNLKDMCNPEYECDYAEEAVVDFIDCPDYEEEEEKK